jgi:predicted nicotinamide N-methyase
METIVPLTIGLAEIALNIDLNDLNINQKHLEQTMTSNEKTVLLINLNVRFKTSIQQKKLISKNWLKQAASNMQNHLFKILLLEQRKI